MDLPASKIRFLLANGITESAVKSSNFVVYGHECNDGLYIGFTNDPVKRWQEHYSNAFNKGYRDYDDLFRQAIRAWRHNFKHYILAVAKSEDMAKIKEASAIQFYAPALNMKIEKCSSDRDFGFRRINGQIFVPSILSKKAKTKQGNARSDKDRVTVVGIVYRDLGRKRLKTIDGQPFPEGLKISCSKTELDKFEYGTKVKVKVSKMSREGTAFLKAATTALLTKV